MKFLYTTLFSLIVALTAAATLPETERKTAVPIPSFCSVENLIELAKCSCFVEDSEGTITDEMRKLCVSAFGEDLGALEGSCAEYEIGGKIDVDAVRKDIAKADKICVPLYTENGLVKIDRQIAVTERQDDEITIVIIIIIIQC